jgi:hypothetical protein
MQGTYQFREMFLDQAAQNPLKERRNYVTIKGRSRGA